MLDGERSGVPMAAWELARVKRSEGLLSIPTIDEA
jgi:hypothetical protein